MATDDDDRGLAHDLRVLARQQSRRDVLRWLGGASVLGLLGACGDGADASTPDGGGSATPDGSGSASACAPVPDETAGPFPGDGSNGANALAQSGVVRSDIRSSFAGATGVATGVPLTITLKLVRSNGDCAPISGYSIYLWHCDAQGRYSMYNAGVTEENYLRGVQTTDATGEVTFTTIVPGCYPGRWPHMHFEIFAQVPTSSAGRLKVSQLALPRDPCDEAYATSGYEASVPAFAGMTIDDDGSFRDDVSRQMATMTGNVADGFVAALEIGINT